MRRHPYTTPVNPKFIDETNKFEIFLQKLKKNSEEKSENKPRELNKIFFQNVAPAQIQKIRPANHSKSFHIFNVAQYRF